MTNDRSRRSPADTVRELTEAMKASSIVLALVRVGVADAVDDEPVTAAALAEKVGADADALFRLLRASSSLGLFEHVGGGKFVHTPMSRAMRQDAPGNLSSLLSTSMDWGWTLWGLLGDNVMTGRCAFESHFGMDLFSYFDQHPEVQSLCYGGVTTWAQMFHARITETMDLSEAHVIADVGGGNGALLRTVLERNPHLSGILFETPITLRTVVPDLADGPLADRCSLVAGDFQQAVTCAADVYTIKMALHMWSDDVCVSVLRNCVEAARPGARVIVLERLMTDQPTPEVAYMDLHMMLVSGGRERTREEWAALFERSGLRLSAVTDTSTPFWMIEGVVVG
ncbi:methyltransferase [Actinoallomurus iriomotensis]|nr:methyltransferase [Actinoallomurus iriomotensis]